MKAIKLIIGCLFMISTANVCYPQWVNLNTPASRINCVDNINTTLFIGTDAGVYRSTNNGLNWVPASSGLSSQFVYRMAVSGTNIFVSLSGNNVIFLSTNLGQNWTLASGGLPNVYYYSLFASGSYLYAGTSAGVYSTTNNGTNWVSSGLTGIIITSFAKSGSILFAGTSGSGVYKSTDSGINWSACNNGLTTLTINAMVTMETDIFAGTNYGGAVYKTTNFGADWIEANGGITFLQIRDLAALNNHIFAAANDYDGCIYHSTNAGAYWITRNQGFGIEVPTFNCLHILNDYVYAGTYSTNLWRRPYQDLIGILPISSEVPDEFSLEQNYPNPFNPVTKIKFDMPNSTPLTPLQRGTTSLKVFDVTGREVQTLVNEVLQPGTYEVIFDGMGLNSGVYFYQLVTGSYIETRKMILLK
jgi:photosystem II stability/assembly factor-like uncharacterized protein